MSSDPGNSDESRDVIEGIDSKEKDRKREPRRKTPERCGAGALSAVVPVLLGIMLLAVLVAATSAISFGLRHVRSSAATQAAATSASAAVPGPEAASKAQSAVPALALVVGITAAAGSLLLLFAFAGALMSIHAVFQPGSRANFVRALRATSHGLEGAALKLDSTKDHSRVTP